MEALKLAQKIGGHIEIKGKVRLSKKTLPILYTPGVAKVALAVAADKSLASRLTFKKNSVAIISDGSAVLGLGNIGPEGALPVMEGKALLFKALADIDAVPLVLATQDTEEIIKIVKALAPTFGGINLEDISAPRCFEIEERLIDELDIPVMHDDQHGTAVVVLAALLNALRVVGKHLDKA
ncbi:MAG: NADP-dependent malic enzyme, partial [Patescibacteria group bacterium]